MEILGSLASALLVVFVAACWFWQARNEQQSETEPPAPAEPEPKEWWRP